jgi:hypothetical protein
LRQAVPLTEEGEADDLAPLRLQCGDPFHHPRVAPLVGEERNGFR